MIFHWAQTDTHCFLKKKEQWWEKLCPFTHSNKKPKVTYSKMYSMGTSIYSPSKIISNTSHYNEVRTDIQRHRRKPNQISCKINQQTNIQHLDTKKRIIWARVEGWGVKGTGQPCDLEALVWISTPCRMRCLYSGLFDCFIYLFLRVFICCCFFCFVLFCLVVVVWVMSLCFSLSLSLSLVGSEATVPSSVKASLQHQRWKRTNQC